MSSAKALEVEQLECAWRADHNPTWHSKEDGIERQTYSAGWQCLKFILGPRGKQ